MKPHDVFAEALARGLASTVAPIVHRVAPHCHPDTLSVARAALAAPLVLALARGWPAGAALAIYGVAWLTDLLDGSVARDRRRLGFPGNADRGELIDTVADKVLLLTTLIALASCARGAPGGSWYTAVLLATIAGEAYLLGKRLADFRGGTRSYPPMPLGKLKVGLQVIATAALIAAQLAPQPQLAVAGIALLAATLPLVALSIRSKLRRS